MERTKRPRAHTHTTLYRSGSSNIKLTLIKLRTTRRQSVSTYTFINSDTHSTAQTHIFLHLFYKCTHNTHTQHKTNTTDAKQRTLLCTTVYSNHPYIAYPLYIYILLCRISKCAREQNTQNARRRTCC